MATVRIDDANCDGFNISCGIADGPFSPYRMESSCQAVLVASAEPQSVVLAVVIEGSGVPLTSCWATIVTEVAKSCVDQLCSQHGSCDFASGDCRCSQGYTGVSCHLSITPFDSSVSAPRGTIFIPGIGGSALEFLPRGSSKPIHSWVGVDFFGNRDGITKLIGTFDAQTETVENYYDGTVRPPAGDDGLRAITNLASDGILVGAIALLKPQLTMYEPLISGLKDRLPKTAHSLVGFPYDWRQSTRNPRALAMLHEKVLEQYTRFNNRSVDIVTHSMGGLVMRSYVAAYPEAARYIRNWVAIAAPWHGAGKAIKAFMGNERFDNTQVYFDDALALVTGAAAAYELLPDINFPWVTPPSVSARVDGAQVRMTLLNMAPTLTHALSNYVITLPSSDGQLPRPFNNNAWQYSLESRRRWNAVPVNLGGIQFFNVYSHDQATQGIYSYPQSVRSWSDLVLQVATNAQMVDGDETVPLESALNDGFVARERVAVRGTHTGLLAGTDTKETVLTMLGYDCPVQGWWRISRGVNAGTRLLFNQQGSTFYTMWYDNSRIEGSVVRGRLLGQVVGSNSTVSCSITEGCMLLECNWLGATWTAQREIGSECQSGQQQECAVVNGIGVRACMFGFWSSSCMISSCSSNLCIGQAGCVPCSSLTDPARCNTARPYLCANGECVANLASCPRQDPVDACPVATPFRCNDTCYADFLACVRGENDLQPPASDSALCPARQPFMCWGGGCVSDAVQCRVSSIRCAPELPVICANLTCAASVHDCRERPACPPTRATACLDGTCVVNGSACVGVCPFDTPYRCPQSQKCVRARVNVAMLGRSVAAKDVAVQLHFVAQKRWSWTSQQQ
eukprot:TRINITY_DN3837_c0_g1_i1.p1 TRINITY_DN3837_c0_g1~~TRINITY_DN3837_c0_g1_i1.p1  ORF type:complete len:924 (+),score=100.57 TRINITY_DN3837_c0_g1_i1:220-2772(+)